MSTPKATAMKSRVLIKDGEKYSGQYVAKKSFSSHTVISHGTNVKVVRQDALNKGCKNPVVFYVPEEAMAHIY